MEGPIPMQKQLLSGNEAIARGIYEAGVQIAAAYPGTPSTEILETVARHYPEVIAQWAPNEKVAFDVAVGAAYGGRRAIAVMKHVGLNVASEVLFYASYTGAEAGLIVVTADDPGLHSSQNEQDNRHYARFAKVPMLEPSNGQEAKDMVQIGMEISEQFDTPVMLRTTTRISHAKSIVNLGGRPPDSYEPIEYKRNPRKYVVIPGYARPRHLVVEERMRDLASFAETCPQNIIELRGRSLGVITAGISYQYAREIFPDASTLKLGLVWPLPAEMIRGFASQVDRLIVLEELDPFLEENVRLLGLEAEGKSIFPIVDEFTPGRVRQSAFDAGLVEQAAYTPSFTMPKLPGRPPVLCAGCPHRGVFYVLKKMDVVVNSDIGCYALGVLPPLDTTDTIGCMGASMGVAHGMALANIDRKNVAVIGDSTFFHAGLPALANMIYNQGNFLTIIVDNHTTAMTGHQGNPGSGWTLQGTQSQKIDFVKLAEAMGVEVVEKADPTDLKSFEAAVQRCLDSERPAVLVAEAPCVFADYEKHAVYTVDEDICNGCTLCFRVGCPAIGPSETIDEKTGRPKAAIDPLLCTGCDLCAQVCARGGIVAISNKVKAL
jgi:indolepyruvate ferredoxin oxidoreductase alpha subunit